MGTTQSVIVYRNPLEQMFWESMLGGGAIVFFVIIGAAILGVLTYVWLDKIIANERRVARYSLPSKARYGTAMFLIRHQGTIAIGVSVLSLILAHIGNMRGWFA